MGDEQSQKTWLSEAKRALSKTHPGLTWDDFATLAGIEPRAFKTYRMPADSKDYRKIPPIVDVAIKALLEKASQLTEPTPEPSDTSALLIPALAALVIRQARASLIDGRMIAGTSKFPGAPVGLSPEDRAAMALVSRACLANGVPDRGAEIHELLWSCTLPLEKWLDVPEVKAAGLGKTNLIHREGGIPTAEAEELASRFTGITAGLEEQLFRQFLELIGKQPTMVANEYYTRVRNFVVRHPTCTSEELRKFGNDVHLQIWMLLNQEFYEPVPESWQVSGEVPLCAHCSNAMTLGKAGLLCRTAACAVSNPAEQGGSAKASDILRVTRGIKQYWIEPGLDEIRLFDALKAMDLPVALYPIRDRVDISVGEAGIDLKSYTSPEMLGRKFKNDIGGLAYYEPKLLVIPDWVQKSIPSYLDRLKAAIERCDIKCMTVSQTIAYFKKGAVRA